MIFIATSLFAQQGNDRSADFFSNWYDTILMLRDTSLTQHDSTKRVQDGRGWHTPLLIGLQEIEIESDFYAGDSTVFVDSSLGRVGIGTNAPDSTLHIVGGLHVTGGVKVLGELDAATASVTTLPSFSVYQQDAGQAGIANATWTKIVWHTEEWDSNNDFASNRFTPTEAGNYVFRVAVMWATGDIVNGEWWNTALYKNGSIYKSATTKFADTGNYVTSPTLAFAQANGSTDYFEIYVYHVIGVAKNTITTGELTPVSAYTFFQGHGIQ